MLSLKKVMIFSMTLMLFSMFIITIGTSNTTASTENYDYRISQMPETRYFEQYVELSATPKSVIIYPILTQSAYGWDSIHDFYLGRCNTCNLVKIDEYYDPIFSVGAKSFRILEFLGYDVVDDVEIDTNPDILKKYDSVILLHNEFVTENEFSAINSHPNVIHLYPGAFNSKVKINGLENSMILERGPGYPQEDIQNGFDWEYENSNIYDDTTCENWKFYEIDNGYMLNCNPEYLIQNNVDLLIKLKQLTTI
jgi:hypothetical protein